MRPPTLSFGLAAVLASSATVAPLPPRAISLHAEAHHVEHQIAKRLFSPNQLWNDTGPIARDVRQKVVLDCWWKAAEAVIAHVSPVWIENLFIDPATKEPYLKQGTPQPQADFPIVQLWDPHTLQAYWFNTTIHDRSQSEDKGMGGFFWPDALTQALGRLGRQTEINGVDRTTGFTGPTNSRYEQPLEILTGYPASARDFDNYDTGNGTDYELWSHFRYCNSTPIMFNTQDVQAVTTEDQFGDHHVYPVVDAYWDESGQRWVKVRNVWGKTEIFKFEDVKANGNSALFLRDWNKLEWQESWE